MKTMEPIANGEQRMATRRRMRVFDGHVCPAAWIEDGPPPILHHLTTLRANNRLADYRRDWERTMPEYFTSERAPELSGVMIMEGLQYGALLGSMGTRILRGHDLTKASFHEVEHYEKISRSEPLVKGFTAYVDLSAGFPALRESLSRLAEHKLVRCVRFFLFGLSDQQIVDAALIRALRLVGKHGLTFMAHFSLPQSAAAARMMALCADVRFTCFLVQPPPGTSPEEYRRQWAHLAALPNCVPKLSLCVFRAPRPGFGPAIARLWRAYNELRGRSLMTARPERDGPWILYPRIVADLFGPNRLMYASDWPWRTQHAFPAEQIHYLNELVFRHCSESELAAFYGGNAERFFGLDSAQ